MQPTLVTDMQVDLFSRRWGRLREQAAVRKVITETALRLYVDNEHTTTFCCLNEFTEELALGYLYTSGRIDSLEAVSVVSGTQEELRLELTGVPPVPAELPPLEEGFGIAMSRVWRLMRVFVRRSAIFASSGGVHSALLCHDEFQLFNEDIGRHNCVDKIAGRLLGSGRLDNAAQAVLLTSGRVTVEIMTKLLRLGIPVLVSRTTPTAQAVSLARSRNITLLGYVRGSRAVVYAGRERITA